ncbi:uncharacterized protein LOC121861306 isoform X2 [Homarus americanus]|uniref:uncharacterized protein LOC121861306 isoform X2 n=1 Tax=Homarus americanus TaxID=6706 RepID=UPI001C467134|nr:uncharacterized protein LOC121861306 isoform X2 [Homarus americanus]
MSYGYRIREQVPPPTVLILRVDEFSVGLTGGRPRELSGTVSVRGDELPLVSSPPPHVSSPTHSLSSPPSSLSSTPLTTHSTSTLDDGPQASATSPKTEAPDMTSLSTPTLQDAPQTSSAMRDSPGAKSPSVSSTPAKSPSRVESTAGSPLRSSGSTPSRHVSAIPVMGSVEGASPHTTTLHIACSPQSGAVSPHDAVSGSHSSTTSPQKIPVSPQKVPATPPKIPITPMKIHVSPQKLPVNAQQLLISPQKMPVSPQKMPVSPQKMPVSPQKIPVSPQKIPVSPLKMPVGPPKIPVSPQKAPGNEQTPVNSPQRGMATTASPQRTPTSAPATPSRPPSVLVNAPTSRPVSETLTATLSPPERSSGGVVVVVNGGPSTDPQQRHTNNGQVRSPSVVTIPVGDAAEQDRIAEETPSSQQLGRKKTNTTPRKTSTKTTANGEAKRNTHEKSKSVTIVVNDQQVTYSNTPHTYTTTELHHTNGITNGDLHHLTAAVNGGDAVVVNGHALGKNDSDNTRPSSAASVPGGTKVDPDIQVRPLVGWWGEGGSGGSVLEDTASSDECHRSTLTLVHSPARTYLSGETGDTVGGEDSGEAWSGVVSGVCGIILIIGAASLLRLPRLLYEYGAGSFLAAWCAVLVVVAAPLAYLEACLSQFSSSASLAVWRLIPIARGVGWSTVVVCFYWAVVVLSYVAPVVHYILLWINPDILKDVVSPECSVTTNNYTNTGDWTVDYHRSCVYNLPDEWQSGLELTFTWPLPAGTAAAALSISIIAACGPRTMAGITGASATLAVIGLSLQLGIGLTEIFKRDFQALWELARPFLIPQLDTLLQPRVWCAAVAHVLLSIGLGVGLLMNFSSRGSFRFTLRRHLWGLVILLAIVTALVSVVTVLQLTILASDRGLSVDQALVSFRNESNDTTPEEAVGISTGAAVITASHLIGVVTFPFVWLRQLVSTLIFIGLWCSGVTTGTVCVHTLIAALRDARDCLPRPTVALMLLPLLLAAATPSVTKGGAAVVALLDGDVLTPVVLWPPFTLTLAITAIYGIHKVRKDFTFMLEATVSWLWIPVWGVFIPLSLLGVVIWASVLDGQAVAVTDGPGWRTALVWGLRALVLLPVPITAIYVVKSQLAYGVIDKVASSLQSSREWGDWGPQDPIEHHNWRRWREDETRPITSLKRRFANRPLTYTHSTLSSESSSTLTRLRNKYQRNGTASIL